MPGDDDDQVDDVAADELSTDESAALVAAWIATSSPRCGLCEGEHHLTDCPHVWKD